MTTGTSVKDNSDMNDFKTPGNYSKNNTSGVKSLKNCPFDDAFTLKIEYPTGVDVYLSQTYRLYNTGEIAYRYYDSNTDSWSSYVYFSDDATVQTSMESYMFTTSGEYSADCNDITQPGLCKKVIAPSAVNSPGFYAYLLVIKYVNLDGTRTNFTQVAFPYASGDPIKIRYRLSNVWSEWA